MVRREGDFEEISFQALLGKSVPEGGLNSSERPAASGLQLAPRCLEDFCIQRAEKAAAASEDPWLGVWFYMNTETSSHQMNAKLLCSLYRSGHEAWARSVDEILLRDKHSNTQQIGLGAQSP